MSCRPAVMPATKTYVVRRLDSVEQEVTVLKKATGSEILDRVCKSLSVLERDYFGLRYIDKNGEHHWVNLRNPLQEQLAPGSRPVMEMRVKYFIKPQKILQPSTRLHFYKQLKKDLLLGKLQVTTSARAARLTALIAQIDKGEFRSGIQYHHKVACQADNDNMEARIRHEHQKLSGTLAEVAIEKFLEEVASLPDYGVEFYRVVDAHRLPKIIGVGPDSVQLLTSSLEPLRRFSYSSIQYTAFHAKKFTAIITANNGTPPEEVEFELRSRASSQALYRAITEFHTFFRRETVSRVVKTAGFCKSLLGNFKGQDPDRFYFDVMRTHREVVDHVWSILHPRTSNSICTPGSPESRNHRNHRNRHLSSTSSTTTSRNADTSPTPSDEDTPPPLPPPSRHMQRSRSVTDNILSPSSTSSASTSIPSSSRNQRMMPPLPPYSQRSNSSDAIVRGGGGGGGGGGGRRPPGHHHHHHHLLPHHGPHMASMSSFNPYLSPSISEASDLEEQDLLYASGGSDCVTMTTRRSDRTYIPSTRSDPGTGGVAGSSSNGPRMPSELYITSEDSECSAASFDNQRINSPPPLYSEVDPEHTAPLSFSENTPPDSAPHHVSPIIPLPNGSTVFNFDAAAVLVRTRELEGELQRLRTAMTCRLCKQNPIGATFCPCGHTVCCFECARSLRNCWECEGLVHSIQRMILA